MSEYQYIAFRAVDAPVSHENLAYMRKQSSRAKITPWSLDNEYHFGDFHGNTAEMLRRGYDFYLHYANFGIRSLLVRLPHGLPDPAAAQPYLDGESVRFVKDKQGSGGILSIIPYYEPGELEELWDIGVMVDPLAPLRAEILAGDLRPLYLARLAVDCASNHAPEETFKAPVPAGLNDLSTAQSALAEFYGIRHALIAAAGRQSGPLPQQEDPFTQYSRWLAGQPAAAKDQWLMEILANKDSPVRSEILAKFRQESQCPAWPTTPASRTIAELSRLAEDIAGEEEAKTAAEATRQRKRELKKMAADPTFHVKKIKKLVDQRSTRAYQQAARILADLRDARRHRPGGPGREASSGLKGEVSQAEPPARAAGGRIRAEVAAGWRSASGGLFLPGQRPRWPAGWRRLNGPPLPAALTWTRSTPRSSFPTPGG